MSYLDSVIEEADVLRLNMTDILSRFRLTLLSMSNVQTLWAYLFPRNHIRFAPYGSRCFAVNDACL